MMLCALITHSYRNYTNSQSTSNPFTEFVIKAPRFNLIISRLTNNTYVLVVLPPGETDLECARFNIMAARATFMSQEIGGRGSPDTRRSIADGQSMKKVANDGSKG